MRRLASLSLLAVAGCGQPSPEPEQPPRIVAGEWEIRSAVVAARGPTMPVMARDRLTGPRPTRRLCITRAQAESADATFLAQRPGDCVQRGVALQSGRLTGAMVCSEAGLPPSVIALDGRYGPDRYVLRMEMTSPLPDGATIALDVVTVGQRIGNCQGGEDR